MSKLMAILLLVLGAAVGCVHGGPDRARAESHRDLGDLYLQRGEVEMAIRELRGALAIWDGDPLSHFSIGEAYRRKREYRLAETHLQRAVQLDPQLLDARLNLGVVYLEQERYEDAVRENQILIEDPTFLSPARALVNGGWAHYKLGHLDEAERLFRMAIAADGSGLQAHLNLGVVLYDRDRMADAVLAFEKALELIDGLPPELFSGVEAQTRFRCAMAYMRLGQRQKAIGQLERAAAGGGDSQWGEKSREYLAVLR